MSRLPLACQVANEFSFTPVPQADLKHFIPKSSLNIPRLPGRLTLGGIDCLPNSHSLTHLGIHGTVTLSLGFPQPIYEINQGVNGHNSNTTRVSNKDH